MTDTEHHQQSVGGHDQADSYKSSEAFGLDMINMKDLDDDVMLKNSKALQSLKTMSPPPINMHLLPTTTPTSINSSRDHGTIQLEKTPLPDQLKEWLPEFVGRPDMCMEDFSDGFVLVQILSLISPSSIDLAFFITDEALSHPNLPSLSKSMVLSALNTLGIPIDPQDQSALQEEGKSDVWNCARVAAAMWDWHTGRDRAAERVDWGRVERIKSAHKGRRQADKKREREESMVDAAAKAAEGGLSKVQIEDKENAPLTSTEEEEAKESAQPAMITETKSASAVSDEPAKLKGSKTYFESEADDYDPADVSFKACLRWILQLILDKGSQVGLSSNAIAEVERMNMSILDAHGYIDHKAVPKDHWKEVLRDLNPFCESMHANIFDAFLTASVSHITIDDIVDHLKKTFPTFNEFTSYPYDLEDALLLWINLCAATLRELPPSPPSSASTQESSPPPIPLVLQKWTEAEDLLRLKDGRGLCILAAFYNLPHGTPHTTRGNLDLHKVQPRWRGDAGSRASSGGFSRPSTNSNDLTLPYRVSNLELFEEACGKCAVGGPPWRAEELASLGEYSNFNEEEEEEEGSFRPLGGFRTCVVTFMCKLFEHCRNLGVRTFSQRQKVRVQRKVLREVSAEVVKSRERAARSGTSGDLLGGGIVGRGAIEQIQQQHKPPASTLESRIHTPSRSEAETSKTPELSSTSEFQSIPTEFVTNEPEVVDEEPLSVNEKTSEQSDHLKDLPSQTETILQLQSDNEDVRNLEPAIQTNDFHSNLSELADEFEPNEPAIQPENLDSSLCVVGNTLEELEPKEAVLPQTQTHYLNNLDKSSDPFSLNSKMDDEQPLLSDDAKPHEVVLEQKRMSPEPPIDTHDESSKEQYQSQERDIQQSGHPPEPTQQADVQQFPHSNQLEQAHAELDSGHSLHIEATNSAQQQPPPPASLTEASKVKKAELSSHKQPTPPTQAKPKQKAGLLDGTFRRKKKKPEVKPIALKSAKVEESSSEGVKLKDESKDAFKDMSIEGRKPEFEASPTKVEDSEMKGIEESRLEINESNESLLSSTTDASTLSDHPKQVDDNALEILADKTKVLIESQQPSDATINLEEYEHHADPPKPSQTTDAAINEGKQHQLEAAEPLNADDSDDLFVESQEEERRVGSDINFSLSGVNVAVSEQAETELLNFERKFIEYDDDGEDISEGVQFYQPVPKSQPAVEEAQEPSLEHVSEELEGLENQVGSLNPTSDINAADRIMSSAKSTSFFVSWDATAEADDDYEMKSKDFEDAAQAEPQCTLDGIVEEQSGNSQHLERHLELDDYEEKHLQLPEVQVTSSVDAIEKARTPSHKSFSDMDDYEADDPDTVPNFDVDRALEDEEEDVQTSIEADAKILAAQQKKAVVKPAKKTAKSFVTKNTFGFDDEDEDSFDPPVVDVDELLKGGESDEEDSEFAKNFTVTKSKAKPTKKAKPVHKRITVGHHAKPKASNKQQGFQMQKISDGYFDADEDDIHDESPSFEVQEDEWEEEEVEEEESVQSPQKRNKIVASRNEKHSTRIAPAAEPEIYQPPPQPQAHPSPIRRGSSGLMTFPLPENGEEGVEMDPDTEAAWARNQSKIIQVKKRLERRNESDRKLVKKSVKAVPKMKQDKLPPLTKGKSEARIHHVDHSDDVERLKRQREEEQKKLIAQRSKERAQERAFEREAALAAEAARAMSRLSQKSNPNGQQQTCSPLPPIHAKKRPLAVVKPQSNRQIIKNALVHVCLAGSVNQRVKQEVLEDLESSTAHHFIILFRGLKNHAFRGLYSYDPNLHQVLKVYAPASTHPSTPSTTTTTTTTKATSTAASRKETAVTPPSAVFRTPDSLTDEDVMEFYKYDSGTRSFKLLPTRTFGLSVHAVAVRSEFGRRALMR
ncbi:Calmodulin-regulated spectrin-associated protein 1 [Chytridiales sp. JEL 0842]|nr:Calmodulin-regulated spectrin-associated protein 1 [Chytridiales sp. JEL 0842]